MRGLAWITQSPPMRSAGTERQNNPTSACTGTPCRRRATTPVRQALAEEKSMDDPWNPGPRDVREWAYDEASLEPCQDWDLALLWNCPEKAILEAASDPECPKREYMVGILYLVVGSAVREKFKSHPLPVIEGFIERSKQYDHPDIQQWRKESFELLKDPSRFSYEYWCSGGHRKPS